MSNTDTSIPELKLLHQQWLDGRSKNDIERVEFNDPYSHGKFITRLWREIGLETEREHPLSVENRRLKDILDANGIDY